MLEVFIIGSWFFKELVVYYLLSEVFSKSWFQRNEFTGEPFGDDTIDVRGADIKDCEDFFSNNDLEGSLEEVLLLPEAEKDNEEDDVHNEGLV